MDVSGIVNSVGTAISTQLAALDWLFLLSMVFILDMVKDALKARSAIGRHFWFVVFLFGAFAGVVGWAATIEGIPGMIAGAARHVVVGIGMMGGMYTIGVRPIKALSSVLDAQANKVKK